MEGGYGDRKRGMCLLLRRGGGEWFALVTALWVIVFHFYRAYNCVIFVRAIEHETHVDFEISMGVVRATSERYHGLLNGSRFSVEEVLVSYHYCFGNVYPDAIRLHCVP